MTAEDANFLGSMLRRLPSPLGPFGLHLVWIVARHTASKSMIPILLPFPSWLNATETNYNDSGACSTLRSSRFGPSGGYLYLAGIC